MKYRNILLNICLLSLSTGFVACSSESGWGEPEPDGAGKDEVLEIEVVEEDFDVTGDKESTRSTQSGNNVNFQNGDYFGITFYKGSTIIADNLKMSWSGGKLNADPRLLYETYKDAQFYCYYPYDESCSGVTTDAALKQKLPVTADQSTKELYKKCDIMSASGTITKNKPSFQMKHLRSCISVDKFTKSVYFVTWGNKQIIKSGDYETNYTINVQNPAHNKVFANFFKGEDGVYRCIVEPGTTQAYDLCFTPKTGSMISKALSNGSSTYVAGTRYHHATGGGEREYSFQDIEIGSIVYATADKELKVAPANYIRGYDDTYKLGKVIGYKIVDNRMCCYIEQHPDYEAHNLMNAAYLCIPKNSWAEVKNDPDNNRETLLEKVGYSSIKDLAKELNDMTSLFPGYFGKWGFPVFYDISRYPNITQRIELNYYLATTIEWSTDAPNNNISGYGKFDKFYYNGNLYSQNYGLTTYTVDCRWSIDLHWSSYPTVDLKLYNVFEIDL